MPPRARGCAGPGAGTQAQARARARVRGRGRACACVRVRAYVCVCLGVCAYVCASERARFHFPRVPTARRASSPSVHAGPVWPRRYGAVQRPSWRAVAGPLRDYRNNRTTIPGYSVALRYGPYKAVECLAFKFRLRDARRKVCTYCHNVHCA